MAKELIEIVRRGMDAFNRRDRDSWLALCDPHYESVPSGDWPETDPIRGPEAAWDFYMEVDETWEGGPYEVHELIDAQAGRVVAHLDREMRGRVSGAEVVYDYWVVFTFRDHRIQRVQWFEDRTQALEAVGLGE